ncbi:hypothetical protein PFISCL1PPCAC_15095 [Pristionchus fissidentatus]|uniref:Caveolin n=1 Tax=Pristionchus fissidentatus TaxID=1538716 RepID=A0AAV5VZH3_9BILA|nr:hypothetical protein PFISCL1PPCAC_15095 [Pristionchus fissidentatus]
MSTEEKVEMEAVPLKTDTDETKKEEETEVVAPKKEAPKKSWLFPKKKTEEDIEEGKEKEKTKKKYFWNRCKTEAAETTEEKPLQAEMSIGIDMQMRDEKQINDHVKFSFEDVFGEPDSFHSWDCAWRTVFRVFEFTRTFFYRLFAVIFCIPAAFIFGIFFAFFAAINNFFVTPLAKLASIPLAWISKAWSFLVSNVFDPISNSIGLCFSKIHVRKYGINNAPTDLIGA